MGLYLDGCGIRCLDAVPGKKYVVRKYVTARDVEHNKMASNKEKIMNILFLQLFIGIQLQM